MSKEHERDTIFERADRVCTLVELQGETGELR